LSAQAFWRSFQGVNPAIGITSFEERSRERVLQADEFERFFAALENEEETFRDFVMLTLLTGARKSNVLSMRWENLNLRSGNWTIPSEQSKNSQSQFIVLTDAELEILTRTESGPVTRFVSACNFNRLCCAVFPT
jgi:integrase